MVFFVAAHFENLDGYEMNVPNGLSKIRKTCEEYKKKSLLFY